MQTSISLSFEFCYFLYTCSSRTVLYECRCNLFKCVGLSIYIVHIHLLTQWYLLKGATLLEFFGEWFKWNVFFFNRHIEILKFRPVLQKVCFMHVSQCRWCTGKASSPNHRFASLGTKLWPLDSEFPPTGSRAAQAGREESGTKEQRETEEEERMKRQWQGGGNSG